MTGPDDQRPAAVPAETALDRLADALADLLAGRTKLLVTEAEGGRTFYRVFKAGERV